MTEEPYTYIAPPAAVAEADQVVAHLTDIIQGADPLKIVYTLLNLAALHVVAVELDDDATAIEEDYAELSEHIQSIDALTAEVVTLARWLSSREVERVNRREGE